MKLVKLVFVFLNCALSLFFNNSAHATTLLSIPKTSFGTNTVYESFEEPIDYTNAEDNTNGSHDGWIVVPGKYHDYTFNQSGISLTAPIPNIIGPYLPMIAIYRAQQGYGFGVYGSINSSNLPPDGNKFLVEYGSSSIPYDPFVLTLPCNATKIGGYWMMSATYAGNQDKLQIDAYDVSDELLGTTLVPVTSVSDGDWSNNFYGFETSDGSYIKKIAINYWTGTTNVGHPGVDMLMFEPASSIPEPSTLMLLAICGLFTALFAIGKKLRR